jgi:phosphohistidine phosphatase
MDLYVLRHGRAGIRDRHMWPDDSLRPLTDDGRKRLRSIARAMNDIGLRFDLVLSSPYLRARETAEIVVAEIQAGKSLELTPYLEPDGDPASLVADIVARGDSLGSILLVGHEPYLSDFISTLLTGDTGMSMTLKKGGLCHLTVEDLTYGRCATLEWLCSPALLLKMG